MNPFGFLASSRTSSTITMKVSETVVLIALKVPTEGVKAFDEVLRANSPAIATVGTAHCRHSLNCRYTTYRESIVRWLTKVQHYAGRHSRCAANDRQRKNWGLSLVRSA